MRRLIATSAAVSALWITSAGSVAAATVVEAARSGDMSAIRGLLAARADVNIQDPDGSTAILWATFRGDREMVTALIRQRADVNLANEYGVTPLLQASRTGDAAIVAQLLKAGADPVAAVRGGETPLMAAARAGSDEIVRLFLKQGVDVNAREQDADQTALMWASAEGHATVVRTLLAAGAEPNAVARPSRLKNESLGDQGRQWSDHSRGGLTALMYAAREGRHEVAEALLEGGARTDVKTPDNLTALMLAVINDYLDLAAVLLDRGADPNDGSLAELVNLHDLRITSTAADATRPRPDNHNELDPLGLAARFLDKGADPARPFTYAIHADGKGNAGASNQVVPPQIPYALALQNRDVGFLKLFLAAKRVDPNTLLAGGTTPLATLVAPPPRGFGAAAGPHRIAGDRDAANAVTLLLEAGADVNGQAATGDTALHRAAQLGDLKIIQLLAERGATLDVRNKAGLTPLDLAMGKRPPPDPQAPRGGGFGRRDGPQPNAVVLLRELMGLPALPADQLPQAIS